jgi:hypothetical protein
MLPNASVDVDEKTDKNYKKEEVEDEVDEVEDDEDISSMLSNVSSILQGFAFQHHSTSSNEPIKVFPLLLKAEY